MNLSFFVSVRKIVCMTLICNASSSFAYQTYRDDFVSVIKVNNGYPDGYWKDWQFCDPGNYLRAFDQLVQPPQGPEDDTALNALGVVCGRKGYDQSWVSRGGYDGNWSSEVKCFEKHEEYITGFQLKVENGTGDHTAVNAMKGYCSKPGSPNSSAYGITPSEGGPWGQWGRVTYCSIGTAVCGISLKVGDSLEDQTSITDVALACCRYPGW